MILLEVDPNLVRPGWTPLVVVLLLGIVLFLLGRSMLKQFRKIDVPADHQRPSESVVGPEAGERTVVAPSADRSAMPDLRQRPADPGVPSDRP